MSGGVKNVCYCFTLKLPFDFFINLDYLSEIHEQKSVILNANLEFSQWVNVLYDQRMTTALIGRLTHHVELILFPGVNNRLRESSINETLSKITSQKD